MPRGQRVPELITKRRGSVTSAGRRTFTAAFAGSCTSCAAAILPGDAVFYAAGNEGVSGVDCCGDRADADLIVTHRSADHDAHADDDLTVDIAKVLPRGRTAVDACPRCRIIPSSNGACDCG